MKPKDVHPLLQPMNNELRVQVSIVASVSELTRLTAAQREAFMAGMAKVLAVGRQT